MWPEVTPLIGIKEHGFSRNIRSRNLRCRSFARTWTLEGSFECWSVVCFRKWDWFSWNWRRSLCSPFMFPEISCFVKYLVIKHCKCILYVQPQIDALKFWKAINRLHVNVFFPKSFDSWSKSIQKISIASLLSKF